LSETYKRFSDDGACSLRRFQYQLASKNAAMAIWLGKQRLGQKEDPNSAHAFDGALKAYIDLHRSMIASDYKKNLYGEQPHQIVRGSQTLNVGGDKRDAKIIEETTGSVSLFNGTG
jgi:hypothetical protein